MPSEAAPAQLDKENPWPGLLSFTEVGQAFFHGRDRDIAELLRLVQRQTLTVLFGQSGLGKTSLLSAGLFPELRLEGFLPVYIRLDLHDPGVSPLGQVWAALAANLREHRVEGRAPEPGETLWSYFHDRATEFWDARSRLITPVLALDQFEEVFTVGGGTGGGLQDLLDQLAELVENRIPPSVREALDAEPDSAARFDFGRAGCKVILSFREDFLPQFEGLRRLMPSSAGDRLRLQRMTGQQAREAILLSGGHLVADGVADRIIAFVAGERRAEPQAGPPTDAELERMEVDPALLSLVCRQLNNKRRAAGLDRITADLLADESDEIIADFYRTSVADLGDPVRRFIEDHLLTSEGFRNLYAWADALRIPGVTEEALNTLIGRRLLRAEEYSRAKRIELAHDVLTGVIREERDQRRAGDEARSRAEQAEAEARREREEREVQARLAQEALARERAANRQTQRFRAIAVCAVLLAVLCGVLYVNSKREQRVAETATAVADKATAGAKAAAAVAEEQTKRAGEAKAMAEQNFRSALAVVRGNVEVVSHNFSAGRISTEVARNLAESSRTALASVPVEELDPEALRILCRLYSVLAGIYDRVADPAAMQASARAEQEAADRLATLLPADPEAETMKLDARFDLSNALASEGDLADGLRLSETVLRMAEQADAEAPGTETGRQRVAFAHIGIGQFRAEGHDLTGALEEIVAGIAILEPIAAAHENDVGWQLVLARSYNALAAVQSGRGDLGAAWTEWTKADNLLRAAAAKLGDYPTLDRMQITTDYGLASISIARGNLDGAWKRVRSHTRKLTSGIGRDDNDMDWNELGIEFFILAGDLHRDGDDLARAETEYDKADTYARRWAERPRPYVNWTKYAVSHDLKVAGMDVQRNRLDHARILYGRAEQMAADLATKHPSYVGAVAFQAAAQFGLGDVAIAQTPADPVAAWAAYRQGLALLGPLVEAHPDDAEWQHDLAAARTKAAAILIALGDADQAGTLRREAADTMLRLVGLDPRNAAWRRELTVLGGSAPPESGAERREHHLAGTARPQEQSNRGG